jgi:hypothetical protein
MGSIALAARAEPDAISQLLFFTMREWTSAHVCKTFYRPRYPANAPLRSDRPDNNRRRIDHRGMSTRSTTMSWTSTRESSAEDEEFLQRLRSTAPVLSQAERSLNLSSNFHRYLVNDERWSSYIDCLNGLRSSTRRRPADDPCCRYHRGRMGGLALLQHAPGYGRTLAAGQLRSRRKAATVMARYSHLDQSRLGGILTDESG